MKCTEHFETVCSLQISKNIQTLILTNNLTIYIFFNYKNINISVNTLNTI